MLLTRHFRAFVIGGLLTGAALVILAAQAPGSGAPRGPQPPVASQGGRGDGSPSAQEQLDRLGVVGYADHMMVQPGKTVKFMISSQSPRYRADIVRLIHGDANPKGPGFKEIVIETAVNGEYSGKRQALPLGSYGIVSDNPALRLLGASPSPSGCRRPVTIPGRPGAARRTATRGS